MRVAVAAMLLALLSPSAFAADGSGVPSSASTPSSTAPGSTSSANAASTKESSSAGSSSSTANTLVAVTLPGAPMPGTDAPPATTVAPTAAVAPAATLSIAPAATLSIAPAATNPVLDSSFVTNHGLANNALAPIHSLLAPPAAFIKLKTPPRSHSFFDARNTLGFATLGASLTADALSTQKGLAYPGFSEMNPIARPFVQSRTGAAVYNAGSFGLLTGLMYWAHKTEHHKLERILPFAIGGWEGLLSARNYHVIANRPR